MQNASYPAASVPTASMGGLNVSGQGGVILPNGQVALVREPASACSHSVQMHFVCVPPLRSRSSNLTLSRSCHTICAFLRSAVRLEVFATVDCGVQCGQRRHVSWRCGVVL